MDALTGALTGWTECGMGDLSPEILAAVNASQGDLPGPWATLDGIACTWHALCLSDNPHRHVVVCWEGSYNPAGYNCVLVSPTFDTYRDAFRALSAAWQEEAEHYGD